MSELNVYHHELRPGEYDEFYIKYEADKVIAEKDAEIVELKSDIADLRDDKKSTDALLDERNEEVAKLQAITEERDKTIEGLQADYKEACDRLQTANLIKDEQLAATRHQKRKRCLDKAELCESRALFYGNLIPKVLNKDIADASRQKVFRRLKYHKKWHMRWLELAEKFKEAK